MKKMLIVAIVCSFPFFAQAQEFRGGIKGGLNLSNLYIDDVSDENMRAGFHAGLFGQWVFGDAIGIQPEILYSSKGASANYDLAIFEGESKFNLHYIDVPVLAVFNFGDVFNIHAGPYFSFLVGASASADGDVVDDADTDLDRDNFSDMDVGLSGGIGVNLDPAIIGVRYNYGLVKVADSDAADALLGDAKNSVLQFYVAFGF